MDGVLDLSDLLLEDRNLLNQLGNLLLDNLWRFWFWLRIKVVVVDDVFWFLLDNGQLLDDLLDTLSNMMDLLSDDSDLLSVNLNLLDDGWLLSGWSLWKLVNSVVDLLSDDSDLLGQLLDDDDLLIDLLVQNNDLLDSLLRMETSEVWSGKSGDLGVDDGDGLRALLTSESSGVAFIVVKGAGLALMVLRRALLGDNDDLLFKNLKLTSLFWSVSARVDWFQELRSVNDDVQFLDDLLVGNLVNSDLLDDLFDGLLEDVDLLNDDLLLFDVVDLGDLDVQLLDGLLDDSDLMDQLFDDLLLMDDLLSVNSNLLDISLLDDDNLLLSDSVDLLNSVSDDLLDLDDILLDHSDLLSDNDDLLDDGSSLWLWSLEELNDQVSDGLLVNLNLLGELDDLGDLLNDDLLLLFNDGEVSWFVQTVVVWLLVEGNLRGTGGDASVGIQV